MIKLTQPITPYLWFENQAEEAANFYKSVFPKSDIESISHYVNGPMAGQVMTVSFHLEGLEMIALNGGPYYQFSPAISFFVTAPTPEAVEKMYASLSEGGEVLMPMDKYPFSEKFSWVVDKFGVSWQISLGDQSEEVIPFLTFTGDQFGKAEEAINLYTSFFADSGIQQINRFGPEGGDQVGKVHDALFTLSGVHFMAIDTNADHAFGFTGAISFYVSCANQADVDFLWDKLSEDGKPIQCGWIEDKFGITWQVIPEDLPKMLSDPDPERALRATEAMLKMQKIEIEEIRKAFEGRD